VPKSRCAQTSQVAESAKGAIKQVLPKGQRKTVIAILPALSRIYRFSEWVWRLCRPITGNLGEPKTGGPWPPRKNGYWPIVKSGLQAVSRS